MEKTKRIYSSSTQIQTQPQTISIWIPWDLWFQILSFLPVRSLLVFRSVCKSFLPIIDDPEFVSLHLRRFPNNALETRFITRKNDNCFLRRHDFVVFEIKNLGTNNIIHRVKNPRFHIDRGCLYLRCHHLYSLNGLFLYKDGNSAVLWNPSIKKQRRIPLPSPNYLELGLGHDGLSSSNDYKIVAFDVHRYLSWVYSVKTDTWTEILDTRSPHKLREHNFVLGPGRYYSRPLFIKGRAFWIEHYDTTNDDKLLWFDFETERFCYCKTPPYSRNERMDQMLVILDGGSSLGVLRVDEDERVFVCALETDTMSWTLRYKLDPPHGLGRSIYEYTMVSNSRLEEKKGELLWKYWELGGPELHIVSYEFDIKAQMYRKKLARVIQDCLYAYIESLVLHKIL